MRARQPALCHDQTTVCNPRKFCEIALDRCTVFCIDWLHVDAERRCHCLDCSELPAATSRSGVPDDRHPSDVRRDFLKELQPLCADTKFELREAGSVSSGPRQACYKSPTNRIGN